MQIISWKELKEKEIKNKILLLPTDTVYGFHCLVDNKKTIEKINKIKKRSIKKTFIILISDISDLKKFNIKYTTTQKKFLKKIWPGKISVIFDYNGNKYKFLSKQYNSLAFRVPNHSNLRDFLKKTGPMISTSANISNTTTLFTPKNIPKKIANVVDFCVSSKQNSATPSTLIKILR